MLKDKQILIIDDTPSIRTFLRISLQTQRAVLYEAGSFKTGVETFNQIHPDLVVLDLGLPDKDGLEILPIVKNNEKKPIVIVLTVRKEPHIKAKAYQLGADAYITKPFIMDDLMEVIHEKLKLSPNNMAV
ncbi:MAG: response regulator [Alphaproteobacteria bacterium]|nr:response regulator [Alphaproteobacteria bacterium]